MKSREGFKKWLEGLLSEVQTIERDQTGLVRNEHERSFVEAIERNVRGLKILVDNAE